MVNKKVLFVTTFTTVTTFSTFITVNPVISFTSDTYLGMQVGQQVNLSGRFFTGVSDTQTKQPTTRLLELLGVVKNHYWLHCMILS